LVSKSMGCVGFKCQVDRGVRSSRIHVGQDPESRGGGHACVSFSGCI
jgi:hypothetical protein